MMDKELEAIYKCHEYLDGLDNESKMRVFKYLLDRYGLVSNSEAHMTSVKRKIESVSETNGISIDSETINSETKSTRTNSRKPSKGGSSQSYSLMTDLNLVPSSEQSLKDFFSKFDAKNNYDFITIIVFYLTKRLGVENVGINHIYTCFKHLHLKIPKIEHSLRDTRRRKGWIDYESLDNIYVPVAGENYIEHEIGKT